MINTGMKFIELLNESPEDVVARWYVEASKREDRFNNPENVKYKDKNKEYYHEYFEGWFKGGDVPVFSKPVTKPQPEFTNIPKKDKVQSPGYRGLQYALAASGLPYDKNVQKYEPNIANIIPPNTTDMVAFNNGQ